MINNITDTKLIDIFIKCGGHDKKKIYNAYLKAIKTKGVRIDPENTMRYETYFYVKFHLFS